MSTQFQPFPKIPRLNKNMVVTEKIDGTNAQVVIEDIGPTENRNAYSDPQTVTAIVEHLGREYVIRAGSRKRWIVPGDDNFGFAAWVRQYAQELVELGEGQHFGEWWGRGIQRGYGLSERRFSLFNAGRWSDPGVRPACCDVVPVLFHGSFDLDVIDTVMKSLHETGSAAAPGFMDPEGVIIFYEGHLYKDTFEYRDGKWKAA